MLEAGAPPLRAAAGWRRRAGAAPGRIRELRGAPEDYLRELHVRFADLDLHGMDVLLDCANGATYQVAPEIFRRLGATVSVIADAPDGRNINADCGSTHVDELASACARARTRWGSRSTATATGAGGRPRRGARRRRRADGAGRAAPARARPAGRRWRGGHGDDQLRLPRGDAAAGVAVGITNVGDRYVLEELRTRGWTLGGEQSGHIIDMAFNRTGDGIASALLTLEALGGRDLSERDAMRKLPQRLVNVRVRDRGALEHAHELEEAVRAAEHELSGRGRVLVRRAAPSRWFG